MDNFMDRITHRFNAQEIIKANAQAEAQELGKLREQMKDYDKCMQDMRKLNLKNVETAEKLRSLAEKINALAGRALAGAEERGKQESGQTGRFAAMQETLAAIRRDLKRIQEEAENRQTGMNEIRESILAVQEASDVSRGDIAMMRKGLATETMALQTELTTVHGEISSVEEQLKAVRGDSSALQDKLSAVRGDTSLLQDGLKAVHEDMSAVKDKLTLVLEGTSVLRDELSVVHEDSSSMKDRLTAVREDTSALRTELASLRSDGTSLQTEMAAARSDTASLQETAETMQSEINRMQVKMQSVREITENGIDELRADVAELMTAVQEMKELSSRTGTFVDGLREKLKTSNQELEEFMHRESVKVYRNVQAVILEELRNQTAELNENLAKDRPISKHLYALIIVTLLVSMGNLGVLIAWICGFLA